MEMMSKFFILKYVIWKPIRKKKTWITCGKQKNKQKKTHANDVKIWLIC